MLTNIGFYYDYCFYYFQLSVLLPVPANITMKAAVPQSPEHCCQCGLLSPVPAWAWKPVLLRPVLSITCMLLFFRFWSFLMHPVPWKLDQRRVGVVGPGLYLDNSYEDTDEPAVLEVVRVGGRKGPRPGFIFTMKGHQWILIYSSSSLTLLQQGGLFYLTGKFRSKHLGMDSSASACAGHIMC